MKLKLALFTAVLALAACGPQTADDATSQSADQLEPSTGHGQPDSAMLGIHWARGEAKAAKSGGTSADMTWHNGDVETSTAVVSIFWGTSWASYSGDKISGIDSFYQGIGGSSYFNTNTEYTGLNGEVVGTGVTYGGHLIDTSAAVSHSPRVSDINTEVCNALAANGITPVTNGYYPVYTDTPRGHAGYCAWHSYGTCAGVNVQFGFFFKLDGDPGCDPQDTWTTHSQGLAAIANVSGHEISEMVTDPRNGGWYDSSGGENGDKCAWTFDALVTFKNGSTWKIQPNWSNAAYDSGTGFPNSSGQKGCLQTK
jgi:hypothetical protein